MTMTAPASNATKVKGWSQWDGFEDGKLMMYVLNGSAEQYTFDRAVPSEMKDARAAFAEARAHGMTAYAMRRGAPDELVRDFPEEAEKVVLAHQMAGG